MLEERAKILFNRKLTADTWLVKMKSPGIAKSASPGQFVMIRVRPGMDPLLRRPFSICCTEQDSFMVVYRVVGRGTSILTGAERGEVLPVLGPLGKGFELPASDRVPLLVGGGIGVAPLFFLAQRLKRRKTVFMMGFASAKEVLSVPKTLSPRTRVTLATDDGSKGHAGFVTSLLEEYLATGGIGKQRHILYTCGPKAMLKRVAEVATLHGLPCQFSLEATMACGLGACLGCAVKASAGATHTYHHVCREGPVFEADAIDWNAL